MSKHPEHAPESVTFYHCPHSPCDKKKPKQWPRADNFRNHLKNVHKIMLKPDAGLAEYEIRYVCWTGEVWSNRTVRLLLTKAI